MTDTVVIAGAARTPMGGFQGDLQGLTAPQLGSAAIKAALERAGVKPEAVDEVFMGNVLPAGLGQAPARQASLGAGIPEAAGCTTISKVCGSGMKAVMLATDLIKAGSAEIMVAGGMESMSNAPYLLDRARGGYPHGPRPRARPHVPRRAGGRLRPRAPDGHLRGGMRHPLPVHPRGAGQLRHREPEPRPPRHRGRQLRQGDHRGHGEGPQGRHGGGEGRAAAEGRPGQDPDAEAGLRQGRHGDGGQRLLHFGWRGGAGADHAVERGEAGPADPGGDQGPRQPRPGPGLVHHRPGRCDQQGAGARRLGGQGRGPLRAERGLRRGRHGGDARTRHPA
ncbi:protein of unknown function (plasmid) [Azospirillum baldaniorum]|uniref:Thiolase N-terminal domain-containing protein n=1 Tax=Azospirillum baldaniorum TaxID=1064539 RepID=A0A9P1JWZ0_9PROT|nr:protein of unknown function [Azospirillum baldaniorum]